MFLNLNHQYMFFDCHNLIFTFLEEKNCIKSFYKIIKIKKKMKNTIRDKINQIMNFLKS